MRGDVIIISDFYNNVDEVREFALQQQFEGEKHFPGKRSASFINDDVKKTIQDFIRPFSGDVIWWGDENSGAFQYATAQDRSWIHVDANTSWAGVLYLTPDAPLSSGTGLYMFKETKDKAWPHASEGPQYTHSLDYTKWEMVDRIGNVYNRLILYRGDLFHVSLDYFGQDINDGRLFQTFFFNTEY
jgi:hypothetical protein